MARAGGPGAEAAALRRRLERLNEASLHLAAGLDFDRVLQVVADSACELTGAGFGAVTAVGESGELEAFVTSGLSDDEVLGLYELPQRAAYLDHLSGLSEPLRIPDVCDYFASLGLPEFRPPLDAGPALVAPILTRGGTAGGVYLSKRGPQDPFTGDDEETLAMFAAQAALAIANARRYRDEQRARSDLEALIHAAPVGVIVLDPVVGDMTLVNREAQRISGRVRGDDDPLDELPKDLVIRRADGREMSLADNPLAQMLLDGEIVRAERIELARADGRSVAMLVNATPIRAADGTVASVVATMQDLTALEELGRLRADILGLARDELRPPLVSVKGAAATLLASHSELDAAECSHLAQVIDSQADRMRAAIAEMSDLARIHTGTLPLSPAPADLARLAAEAAESLSDGADSPRVAVEAEAGLPPVAADRSQISRVLRSILADALRSSDPSAPVRVSAARAGPHATVTVAHRRAEPAALLAAQFAGRESGALANLGGNGPGEASALGLAVAKGVVEAHGGRIWAGNGDDGETQVAFTLPLAQPAGTAAGAADRSEPGRADASVLVVDVDSPTQRYISDTLAAAGYELSFAADAAQAVALALAGRTDLVLAGFAHPDADGVQLMRAMRDACDAPLVFVVDHGCDNAALRLMRAGAADYLAKPFSPTELLARARAALQRSGAGHGGAEPQPFTIGDLTVDYASRTVTVAGRPVALTDTEYRLLCELTASPGTALSSDQLMRRVWAKPVDNPSGPVRSAVKRLRQKLGDDARRPAYIITEPRAGYRIATPHHPATTD